MCVCNSTRDSLWKDKDIVARCKTDSFWRSFFKWFGTLHLDESKTLIKPYKLRNNKMFNTVRTELYLVTTFSCCSWSVNLADFLGTFKIWNNIHSLYRLKNYLNVFKKHNYNIMYFSYVVFVRLTDEIRLLENPTVSL